MPHSLTEGCADVNGARLRYTIFPGPGELLVLHHGWQASQDTWTAFASVVSRKYSVLAFDCRGAGRSGSPPGRSFTIAQLSGDLIGLVDVLFGPAQRFHVAAHSMGGLVGLQLLTSLTSLEKSGRRGRLLSVMLVAPAPFTGIRVSPDYTASTHSAWRLARTDPSAFDALVEETAATQLPLVEGEQDRKALLGHARRFCAINMRCSEDHQVGLWQAMCDFRLDLGALPVDGPPVLIVAGGADSNLPFNISDYLLVRKRLPVALHCVASCGHGLPRDIPLQLAETWLQFAARGAVTWRSLCKARAASVAHVGAGGRGGRGDRGVGVAAAAGVIERAGVWAATEAGTVVEAAAGVTAGLEVAARVGAAGVTADARTLGEAAEDGAARTRAARQSGEGGRVRTRRGDSRL